MELDQIAAAAAPHGEVTGVLAAEPADGSRAYVVSLGEADARRWLVLDAQAAPVAERARVREVASLVAMCELAAEAAGVADEPRVSSPAFLDAVGSAELAASIAVVEAFADDVEARYALPLR